MAVRGRRGGFTLIELLVVIAIIAVLAAMLFPVFVSARGAVNNSVASRVAKQLHATVTLYSADSDDYFPVAMYQTENGWLKTWFGLQTAKTEFDRRQGIISPYVQGFLQSDPTHRALPYMGDGTGFGYNYGYLGSDFSVTLDYSHWPNCTGPASSASLSDGSKTIVFATSAFYKAAWLPEGDGQVYDFGFVDPPSGWNGNPNVDFRHWDKRTVDSVKHEVKATGRAVVAFSDGHIKSLKKPEIKDENFVRDPSWIVQE